MSLSYMIYVLDHLEMSDDFCNDLSSFGINHWKVLPTFKALEAAVLEDAEIEAKYLICSAEAAYESVINQLKIHQEIQFDAILLYCGPHEGFYAKWAINEKIAFLSHNLKELRRAVLWILSGGRFSRNGDAIPPPLNRISSSSQQAMMGSKQGRKQLDNSDRRHRASTETTASLNSNDAGSGEDKLAEIAQLVMLLEALSLQQ